MTSIFEYLYARRPVLNYVCPPVCEVLFSGSGFPSIVLGDFASLVSPGGVRFGGFGNFHLGWNAYPGALCYNVYRAETDDPDAPLVIVFECFPGTDIPLPPGCYRVSAITLDGETALSPFVCYFVPPMLPPEVITFAATNVLATQATLNGQINAVGQSSTAYFEWGTTLAYGNTTPVQNTGDSFNNVPFNATITGLAPNGLYHYRAVGFNGSGEGDGADVTFITTNGVSTFWNLEWTIVEEEYGIGPGTIAKTLGPDFFNIAITNPNNQNIGPNTTVQYLGEFLFTGPAQNAHITFVTTDSLHVQTSDVLISVDGNPVLDLDQSNDIDQNGTWEFDFGIPASTNALISVYVHFTVGFHLGLASGTWQVTLTASEA